MDRAPVGGGRSADVGGRKSQQLRELSTIPPPAQPPGARRQRQVFAAFSELHRAGARPCDADVAEYLRLPVTWIAARRYEIVELGQLIQGGRKIGPAGAWVKWWRPPPSQLELFQS